MATRRYSVGIGQGKESVTEAAGLAVVTANVELTIDFGATIGGVAGSMRREDALLAVDRLRQYILGANWPPA